MSLNTEQDILNALGEINVPDTEIRLAQVARVEGDTLVLTMAYPIAQRAGDIRSCVLQALGASADGVKVRIEQHINAAQTGGATQAIPGVKNVIAVASGKGGVGKSTTAANLALALAYEGARVGILDADIYGPSQTLMMGTGQQRPEVVGGNTFKPLVAHGVQVISMGNLVGDNTPMAWRGPMATGALKQLLHQTQWQEVDYLVVDMPPGTGDITLTLGQSVPVATSVIVTTPQDIALLDARKAIEMFRKVKIDVAGIVENMSLHQCSKCGHREAIFGEHGGDRLAEEYDTRVLGRLPLQMDIRLQADGGRPTVVDNPQSAASLEYRKIAMGVAANLWTKSLSASFPKISIEDD